MLELFNEIVILIITYFCWAFSDNTADMIFKDELGWWYIYFLSLAILTNASFIIYDSVLKPLIRRINQKIVKRRRLKMQKNELK